MSATVAWRHGALFDAVERIEQGGQGEVWRGVHRDSRGLVAIKCLSPATRCASAGFESRFRREAQAIARLSHPGIVRVLEYGTVPASAPPGVAGAPCLVSEWLDGDSLQARGAQPWSRVCEWTLLVLSALAHAHARGVLHLDVKPSNIVFTGHEPSAVPVLIDFGMAALRERAPGDAVPPLGGTLPYMAPEQLCGSLADCGPWTDIFGLGCTVYRVLSGRAPFDGTDVSSMLQAHLDGAPRRLAPDLGVPAALDTWLQRALATHPEERFMSAAEASWALHPLTGAGDHAVLASPGESRLARDDHAALSTRSHGRAGSRSLSLSLFESLEVLQGRPLESTVRPRARAASLPVPLRWDGEGALRQPPPRPLPPTAHNTGQSLIHLRESPMVGRTEARDGLWRALRDAIEHDRVEVVAIRGAAGHGRTRLLEWFERRVEELALGTTLRINLGAGLDVSAALARSMRRHLRFDRLDEDALSAHLASLLQRVGGVDDLEAWISWLRPAQTDPAHQALALPDLDAQFALFWRMLRRLHRDTRVPVILTVDDVHRGSEILRLVEQITAARPGRGLPVVIVLTAEDETLVDTPVIAARLAQACERVGAEVLTVGALSHDECMQLSQHLLGLSADALVPLVGRVGGDPSLLVQSLGQLVDRGVLAPGTSGLTADMIASLELADHQLALWQARLARSVADAGARCCASEAALWRALEVAAALGQLDGGLWGEVCRAVDIEVDARALEALEEALVVRQLASREAGRWRVSHAAARDALASRARAAGRWQPLHAACAAALESRSDAARHGVHLFEAGDHQTAQSRLWAAALDCLSRGLAVEASQLLDRYARSLDALDVADSDVRRGELLVMRGRVESQIGRESASRRCFAMAVEMARRHGWRERLPEYMRRHALSQYPHGEIRACRDALAEIVEQFEAIGDTRGAQLTRKDLGWTCRLLGELERAETILRQVIADFDGLGHEFGLWQSRMLLGATLDQAGRYDEAIALIDVCRAHYRATQSPRSLAFCESVLGTIHLHLGELARARQAFEAAADGLVHLGRPPLWERLGLVLIDNLEGGTDTLAATRDLLRRCVETGRRDVVGMFRAAQLPALAERRAWDEVGAVLREASRELDHSGYAHSFLAEIYAQAAARARGVAPDELTHALQTASETHWRRLGR